MRPRASMCRRGSQPCINSCRQGARGCQLPGSQARGSSRDQAEAEADRRCRSSRRRSSRASRSACSSLAAAAAGPAGLPPCSAASAICCCRVDMTSLACRRRCTCNARAAARLQRRCGWKEARPADLRRCSHTWRTHGRQRSTAGNTARQGAAEVRADGEAAKAQQPDANLERPLAQLALPQRLLPLAPPGDAALPSPRSDDLVGLCRLCGPQQRMACRG